MSDPYDDYAADVGHALARAHQLVAAHDGASLQSALEALRVDLDELRAAVEVAAANATRFGLSSSDVAARKQFVDESDEQVRQLVSTLDSPKGVRGHKVQDPEADPALMDDGTKLDDQVDGFSQFEMAHQDTLFDAQEETLGLLGGTLSSLQRQAGYFGEELATQSELFDTFDMEIDQTQSKLQRAMKRMDTFIRQADGRLGGWCVWVLIFVRISSLH